MLSEEEKQALKYVGRLGHQFVVLDKTLRCSSECPTLESAKQDADECDGTVYKQLPKRQWEKVS